jgi:hypothetical protein
MKTFHVLLELNITYMITGLLKLDYELEISMRGYLIRAKAESAIIS